MSVTEWLLWAATVWAAFLAFVFVDAPILLGRAAGRLRQHNLPHWARHGHTPPDDDTPHARHAKTSKDSTS